MQTIPPLARTLAAAALAVAAGGSAWAQKAGDIVLGAGFLRYTPQDKSTPLRFTSPVEREVPGSGADLPSTNTLGLNAHYFFTDNWAIEGAIGLPPRLKLEGTGTLAGVGELGSARLYGPSVLAKYFFGRPDDKFRLSAGLGLSYAHFADTRLTGGLQNTLGGALGLPPGASSTRAKIDDRFGPVFNLGVNYALTERLGLTLSVSYVRMKTKATLTTYANGNAVATAESRLTLNPIVPVLALTYRY